MARLSKRMGGIRIAHATRRRTLRTRATRAGAWKTEMIWFAWAMAQGPPIPQVGGSPLRVSKKDSAPAVSPRRRTPTSPSPEERQAGSIPSIATGGAADPGVGWSPRGSSRDSSSTIPMIPRCACRGNELAEHIAFTIDTGVQVYFCDPRSPWERATSENTNGLLRQYISKGTHVSMNGRPRPRRTLGWLTPSEAFARAVALTA